MIVFPHHAATTLSFICPNSLSSSSTHHATASLQPTLPIHYARHKHYAHHKHYNRRKHSRRYLGSSHSWLSQWLILTPVPITLPLLLPINSTHCWAGIPSPVLPMTLHLAGQGFATDNILRRPRADLTGRHAGSCLGFNSQCVDM